MPRFNHAGQLLDGPEEAEAQRLIEEHNAYIEEAEQEQTPEQIAAGQEEGEETEGNEETPENYRRAIPVEGTIPPPSFPAPPI